MRHVTAAFAVEAKLVLDDLVGEAEEERIAVGLVVVRVPAGHHEHIAPLADGPTYRLQAGDLVFTRLPAAR